MAKKTIRQSREEQLDLFDIPATEIDLVWRRLEEIRISQDKLRRRMFAEVQELQLQIAELKAEREREEFRKMHPLESKKA